MPSLIAILGLNGSSFKASLDQAIRQSKEAGGKIGSALGGIGNKLGALVGGLTVEEVIRRTVEYADVISDLARRLGMSAEAVQLWDYALKRNGSSVQEAAIFFEKLAQNRHKAMTGNAEMIEAFRKLGVSIDDLRHKRIEDLAAQIGEAFRLGDPQKLIAELKEVGGRGAGAMAAAFREGVSGLFEDARRQGIIIGDGAIEGIKQALDQGKTLWARLRVYSAEAIWGTVYWSKAAAYQIQSMWAGIGGFIMGGSKGWSSERTRIFDEWSKAAEKLAAAGKHAPLTGGGDDEDAKAALDAAKEILKLRETLFEKQRKNDFERLSTEEKLLDLEKRRAAIIGAMGRMDEQHRLIAAADVEDIDAETRAIQRGIKPEKIGKPLGGFDVNALQRIGAYARNPVQDSQLAEARTQTRIMTAMDRKLQELNRKQDGVGY